MKLKKLQKLYRDLQKCDRACADAELIRQIVLDRLFQYIEGEIKEKGGKVE